VTYEAMACGLPVIVTQNSGSLARDKKDGFIVPIRDAETLAEKILFFYENPEKVSEMGVNARKRIEEFTWQRYEDDLIKTYKNLISERMELHRAC